VQKREALDVSLTLQQVPRSAITAVVGELADLALAVETAALRSGPPPNPIPRTPSGPLSPSYLRLPIEPAEGFPQAFRLQLGSGIYQFHLHANVTEDVLLASPGGALLDLPTAGAFLVLRVAREEPSGPRTILRRKLVPGVEYRAAELSLIFPTMRVARQNLNGVGEFGSQVVGGVALN
ncbi:hypothetical protein ACFQ87_39365, partial [Kitasatospora sp. NPDC056531]